MKAKEGDSFPDFDLVDDTGRHLTKSDFSSETKIFYFYPKDDTPGCTKEACNFRDNISKFSDANISIYGISADGTASHKKFKSKYNLNFTLLSDEKKELIKALDIKSLIGTSKRVTFILDKDWKIVKEYPNVSPAEHAVEILDFLSKSN